MCDDNFFGEREGESHQRRDNIPFRLIVDVVSGKANAVKLAPDHIRTPQSWTPCCLSSDSQCLVATREEKRERKGEKEGKTEGNKKG